MSLHAVCDNCEFTRDRYINDSISVAELLQTLGQEHRAESPSCSTPTAELRVSDIDPNINYHLSGRKSTMSGH